MDMGQKSSKISMEQHPPYDCLWEAFIFSMKNWDIAYYVQINLAIVYLWFVKA